MLSIEWQLVPANKLIAWFPHFSLNPVCPISQLLSSFHDQLVFVMGLGIVEMDVVIVVNMKVVMQGGKVADHDCHSEPLTCGLWP